MARTPTIEIARGGSPRAWMTRRQFLAGAALAGVSLSAMGLALEACGAQVPAPGSGTKPSTLPSPVPTGTPRASDGSGAARPVVIPPPVSASYGALLPLTAFQLAEVSSPTVATRFRDVAAEVGIPVEAALSDASTVATVSIRSGEPAIVSQGYRLAIGAASADGRPHVEIRALDEAGLWNGLLSLGQLVVTSRAGASIRAAEIDDAPGFARRGAILDPYVLPDIGVTEESKARLMERLRFAVRYKANFVDVHHRTPWPELVRFCEDHHVELMIGLGYQNSFVDWEPAEWRRRIDEVLDAGARSLALCFDDVPVDDGTALATAQAAAYNDLYDHIRRREPACRMSTVLSPYGGVPGTRTFAGNADECARYLAVMKGALPPDVRVFWTGDGGVFSPTVTTAGAGAYRDAIGRELGLWDNDAIGCSTERVPCRGRAPDLASVITTYMANLAGEALWQGTNGAFALLTSLLYTWNPAAYDADRAAHVAEAVVSDRS